jgi:hypothetical protein
VPLWKYQSRRAEMKVRGYVPWIEGKQIVCEASYSIRLSIATRMEASLDIRLENGNSCRKFCASNDTRSAIV